MVDQAVDNGAIRHMARILAETERAQTDAINDLAAATDADGAALDAVDKETREAEIIALIEATAPGDGTPEGWYADHRLAPRVDADPDRLVAYVGMDADDWTAQVERGADAYRDGGEYEEMPDRDLANHHVRSAFGAPSLDWFETEVVEVSRSDILREGTVGRLTAVEESIRTAADAASP